MKNITAIRSLLFTSFAIIALLTACASAWETEGYSSENDYKFAQTLSNSSPERIKALKSWGVNSREDLAAVIKELKDIKYSNDGDYDTIFGYLRDRDEAKKKNIGVVQQKDLRLEQEQKIAAEVKAKEIRDFPYTLSISCQANGRNITLAYCLLNGEGKGTLEIINGSDSSIYDVPKLSMAKANKRVNDNGEGGILIKLRENYKVSAQSAGGAARITIKIIDNATGKTVITKSGTQSQPIMVQN